MPLKDVRAWCDDLFEPRAGVYWVDFLLSAAVGWAAFAASVAAPRGGLAHAGWTALAALALYRAVLFTHELTHAARVKLPGFPAAWDALAGVPLLLPSFMYQEVHTLHHRRSVYGTPGDPEYLPFGCGPRARIVRYLVEPLVLPALLFARFAILAPVSLVVGGRLRKLVIAGASSLAINYAFRREPPQAHLRRRWLVTEVAAWLVCWTVVALILAGRLPAATLVQWYGISAGVAFVNALRTLGAHRYRNAGGEMDVDGQLYDSVNVPGAWWTELWAPVGLRYHGLHHFVPDLPYHALGTAHRRIVARVPADSPYFRTVNPNLWTGIRGLWRDAGRRRDAQDVGARGPSTAGAASA